VSSKAAATTAGATTEDSTGGKEAPKWRAAVDFKYIRDNAEAVQANADVRKAQVDVARVVTLYDQWLEVKGSADDLRAARNASAAKMKGKLEQAQRDVRPLPQFSRHAQATHAWNFTRPPCSRPEARRQTYDDGRVSWDASRARRQHRPG